MELKQIAYASVKHLLPIFFGKDSESKPKPEP